MQKLSVPPRSAINCGIAFYPYLFAPQNDAGLDYGDARRCFDAKYPDPGRIRVHGELDHN